MAEYALRDKTQPMGIAEYKLLESLPAERNHTSMTAYKWQFSPRFRRHTFVWQSATPIKRIKEALSEIKLVARKEPVLAAEGAVTLLEQLSPALEQVDSSSGALGTTVNKAIETLAPIIEKAEVAPAIRQQWLQRLWQALQDDDVPYIELLGDYWGDLKASGARRRQVMDASREQVPAWHPCMPRGRHQELLALIDKAPFKWWHDRR